MNATRKENRFHPKAAFLFLNFSRPEDSSAINPRIREVVKPRLINPMYDTDINPFDEGTESAPIVADTSEVTEDVPSADSAAETTQTDSTSETPAEKVEEGEKVSETDAKDEVKEEKTLDQVLADVDKEIANEKNASYYRNSLKNFRTAFTKQTEAVQSQFEPLKQFGEVDKVVSELEMLKGLDAVVTNPETNLPEKTVKPFVDKFIETKGIETGIQVLEELGFRPSPSNPELNILQAIIKNWGIDPARIEDHKKFAANGYQYGSSNQPDPEDLALIPENLREAFISLSENKRFEMLAMDEETRDEVLGAMQFKLDKERQDSEATAAKEQAEKQAEQQKQQEFYKDLEVQTLQVAEESGHRLTTNVIETLVKDASLEKREALGIAMVLNSAINGTGAEGKLCREILKDEGLDLDGKLGELFQNWNTECRTAAYYRKIGNEPEMKKAEGRITDLESQMQAKANPIIAHFAAQQANTKKARIEQKNALLTQSQSLNTGINPNEGQSATIGSGVRATTPAEREQILANPFG